MPKQLSTMSTGEVFLSAAQESLAKRMLTPLLEEDDDTIETNSQKLGSLIHPEFDLGESPKLWSAFANIV